MKKLFTIIALTLLASVAAPAVANNWQWQLDQIKADQKRRAMLHEQKKTDADKARAAVSHTIGEMT